MLILLTFSIIGNSSFLTLLCTNLKIPLLSKTCLNIFIITTLITLVNPFDESSFNPSSFNNWLSLCWSKGCSPNFKLSAISSSVFSVILVSFWGITAPSFLGFSNK